MLNIIKKIVLNKKTKLNTTVDLHSHLLPGIDDGCVTIEESIELIRRMKKLGYTKLCITPHVMSKKYPNNSKLITDAYYELKSMLKVLNIDIEIDVAAEYYCDEHFIELINKNNLLCFAKKYVLFELPYTTRPKKLEMIIEKLISLNLKPVLAHPERYTFLKEVRDFRLLKNSGLFFQINVNSLGGFYGDNVRKKALMLSKKGMVDFIGSDLHGQKHFDSYQKIIHSNHMEMLFSNNKILNDNI